jgi:hypothetical protein
MFLFINQKVTYKIIAWLDLCIVLLGICYYVYVCFYGLSVQNK